MFSVLTLVASRWREFLIAALAATIGILYVIWPAPAKESIRVEERIVVKEVEVVKTVYAKNTEKSKVTTTESGKTVIVETEKAAETSQSVAKVEKAVDYSAKIEHNTYSPPHYLVGVSTDKDYNYRLIGGARLGSSPFVGTIEYEPRTHTFAAGLLYQF